jgi:hypothetical protein
MVWGHALVLGMTCIVDCQTVRLGGQQYARRHSNEFNHMGQSNKFHLERLLNPFGVFLHGGSLWIDTLVLEGLLFLQFYHTAPAFA